MHCHRVQAFSAFILLLMGLRHSYAGRKDCAYATPSGNAPLGVAFGLTHEQERGSWV